MLQLTSLVLPVIILRMEIASALSLSTAPLELLSHPAEVDTAPGLRPLDAGSLVMCSMLCVSLIYFAIYALLATSRLITQIQTTFEMKIASRLLSAGASSVYLAPMLCALFFTIEKRAEALTQGSPSMYGYPAKFVCVASVVCAAAFYCQLAFHLCATYTVVSGEGSTLESLPRWLRLWSRLYCLSMLLFYGSLAVMFIGVITMHMPIELVQTDAHVSLSAGTECTLVLSVVYFAVYCAMHYMKMRDIPDATQGNNPESITEFAELVYTTLSCSPMLACLLMGSQINSDWAGAAPSSQLSKLLYVPTFLVLGQVFLTLLCHRILVDSKPAAHLTPDPLEKPCLVKMLMVIRWMLMAALNVSVFFLCWTVRKMSTAPALTNLLASLAIMYFASSLVLWIATTCRALRGGGLLKFIKVMTVAKETLVLCPMLGFLALEAFVRARERVTTSGQAGVPQVYQQYCMYLGVGALGMELAMTVLSGICAHRPEAPPTRCGIGQVLYTIFYISTMVFFSCVSIVAWALITIPPESSLDVSSDARF